MDFSPTRMNLNNGFVSSECNPLQQWGYPDSEGYCSLSPASSTDSSAFSPPYQSCAFSNQTDNTFHTALNQMEMLNSRPKELPAKRSHRNRKLSNQRHSASEREKMRMRNLSTALQSLRRYLPPAVAPVGKALTKIETLRLTIRYISHLSEVLGLDEETLIKKREEEMRRSTMCHVGLCCCQDKMHNLCSNQRPHFPETAYSPNCADTQRLFPEHNILNMKDEPSRLPNVDKASDLSVHMESFSSCALNNVPVQEVITADSTVNTSSPISPDEGFCQSFIDDMWDELQQKNLWTSFQPPEIAQHITF
ncbi:hypothetical protein GDO86_006404 [Hymenochirus boettgeri]|uniref:BHLH domain-containing protein n=1 Tax=Hymenochirus boettgeri TaxID=247094 RepID=A0A8T2JBG6_9PIPI|nr:hypothetical protein GDO86_006404 [Hymenochirus boettgeri]